MMAGKNCSVGMALKSLTKGSRTNMCSVIILIRPGHRWPVIVAANRDEMINRPARPPGRHWPDRHGIVAGLDVLGGGTWLGMNDHGVICGVLNRVNTLGPAHGLKSRGELPLLALDEDSAEAAADSISRLDPHQYRPFNLFVVDRHGGAWLRAFSLDAEGPCAQMIECAPLNAGLSMITAHDLNDTRSSRIRRYLPRFRDAPSPEPGENNWAAWLELLSDRSSEPGGGPRGAMTVVTDIGFGTVSCSLMALPNPENAATQPIWLFAEGRPSETGLYNVV